MRPEITDSDFLRGFVRRNGGEGVPIVYPDPSHAINGEILEADCAGHPSVPFRTESRVREM
jgi:hypothetical protein